MSRPPLNQKTLEALLAKVAELHDEVFVEYRDLSTAYDSRVELEKSDGLIEAMGKRVRTLQVTQEKGISELTETHGNSGASSIALASAALTCIAEILIMNASLGRDLAQIKADGNPIHDVMDHHREWHERVETLLRRYCAEIGLGEEHLANEVVRGARDALTKDYGIPSKRIGETNILPWDA